MIAALVLGFFGSLHCVGMCGPIMLTFAGTTHSYRTFWLYHLGRIATYALLGLALGLLGISVQLLNMQRTFTLFTGLLLITLYGFPVFRRKLEAFYYQSRLYRWIWSAMKSNMGHSRRWLLSGVANGLLPCGLTYVAAASAVFSPTFLHAAGYMVIFGLGTLPALLLVSVAGHQFSRNFKAWIPLVIPSLAVLAGLLLVLRASLLTFPNFQLLVRERAAGLITVCGI